MLGVALSDLTGQIKNPRWAAGQTQGSIFTKVSDTEFKNALLQSPGLSDDEIGKIYLSSKTTDDSTDEKAQTFNATYGPAGVTDYLYLQYLARAYHTAEANRKIAAGDADVFLMRAPLYLSITDVNEADKVLA